MIPVVISVLLLFLGKVKGGLVSTEKVSPFECGFDPIVGLRSPFTTRYFLLGIIFLIFDVELSLIFPLVSLSFFKSIMPLYVHRDVIFPADISPHWTSNTCNLGNYLRKVSSLLKNIIIGHQL